MEHIIKTSAIHRSRRKKYFGGHMRGSEKLYELGLERWVRFCQMESGAGTLCTASSDFVWLGRLGEDRRYEILKGYLTL